MERMLNRFLERNLAPAFLKESLAKNVVQSCALPLGPLEEMLSVRQKHAGKADGMGFTRRKSKITIHIIREG